MKVLIPIKVLGKSKSPWTTKDGEERFSYKINYLQNNGEIIGTISVPENIFNQIENEKEYVLSGIFSTGKNGGYIRVTNIERDK